MKRDLDLMRELLLRLEGLDVSRNRVATISGARKELTVGGYTAEQVDEHLRIMEQAGFLDLRGRSYEGLWFKGLTPRGCDYLDAVRDEGIWIKTKNATTGMGNFSLEVAKELAKGFIRKQIEERTGVKL